MTERIYLEDWTASYGSPYLIAESDEPQTEGPATIVEDSGEINFHPGTPAQLSLAFVDGIRRTEGTLYQRGADGEMIKGIAGAYAVGSVLLEDNQAEYGPSQFQRLLIWSAGAVGNLPSSGFWQWKTISVTGNELDDPGLELQSSMRKAEGALAKQLIGTGRTVIMDGPLAYVSGRKGGLLGYIKTHHRNLLSSADWREVAELPAGSRTSLFALRQDIYSCYMRIGTKSPIGGPYAGIVRLEIPSDDGLDGAIVLADQMAGILPFFAGRKITDPRAPQNLEPVHALENKLRHDLGDAELASRALMEAVSVQSREWEGRGE